MLRCQRTLNTKYTHTKNRCVIYHAAYTVRPLAGSIIVPDYALESGDFNRLNLGWLIRPIDLLIVSAQHSAKKEQFCAPEPRSRTLCAVPLRFSSKHQRLPLFRHRVLLEKSPKDKCACAALRNSQKVYLWEIQAICLSRFFLIALNQWMTWKVWYMFALPQAKKQRCYL